MRKKTFYVIHVITILLVISLRALGQDGFPLVKIIHYGVGHGDCTLIIVRERDASDATKINTVSVLIDVGERSRQSVRQWNEIWQRIQDEGGDRLDYFVVSHFHQDHMGAAARILQRIRRIDRRSGNPIHPWRRNMQIIDRSIFPPGPPTDLYSRWALPRPPRPGRTSAYTRYRAEVDGNWATQLRELYTGDDLFAGHNLTYSQMICIVSNGAIGTTRVAQPEVATANPPRALNENDLSFGFILRVGSFRYYTGGDLSGEGRQYVPFQPARPAQPPRPGIPAVPAQPAQSARSGQSAMEAPLVNYLGGRFGPNFHACAFKFNHHGSEHSTTEEFLRFFNPRIGVFTANHRRFGSGRLPAYELIGRLDNVFPRGRPPGSQRPVLLYTFRFDAQVDATRQVRGQSNATVLATQDIILSVMEEPGFSLRVGQAPRINLFRQERQVDRFIRMGHERYHNVRTQGSTFHPQYNVIDCDRASHTNQPLYYFPPPPAPQPPE